MLWVLEWPRRVQGPQVGFGGVWWRESGCGVSVLWCGVVWWWNTGGDENRVGVKKMEDGWR